jgi:hypothetical protein
MTVLILSVVCAVLLCAVISLLLVLVWTSQAYQELYQNYEYLQDAKVRGDFKNERR